MIHFLLLAFFQIQAFADWKWTVPADTQVFAQPSLDSDVISDLEAGSEIMVANPTYQKDWVIINFYFPGQPKTKGFVVRKIFKKEHLEWLKNVKRKEAKTHQTGKTIGFNSVTSFYAREATEVEVTSAEKAYFSQQFGYASYPQIYFDFPFSDNGSFRVYGSLRQLQTEAEAELKTNGVTTLSQKMKLQETFMSFGIGTRYYISAQGSLWYGFGMELGKGTKGHMEYDDGTVRDLKDSLPTIFILMVSLGLDIRITDSIYILPSANFGASVTSSPLILNSEALVGVGWVF